MNKKIFWNLGLAAVILTAFGCTENIECGYCGHGSCTEGICACEGYYTHDSNGACTTCMTGYMDSSNGCIPVTSVPECNSDTYCVHGTCTPSNGKNICSCETDYKLDNNGQCTVTKSEPTGFCNADADCVHGKCTPSNGVNICTCDNGYHYDTNGHCTSTKPVPGSCNVDADCMHGSCTSSNGVNICSCNSGYSTDSNGHCTVASTTGCYAEFYYTNQWTNTESGGTANFDVYLIGSINDWKEADPQYKMTYLGSGTHGIRIPVKQGQEITYKYYINGWDQDSYQSDDANSNKDDSGNAIAKITSCDQSFGNANGKSINNTDIPNPPPTGDCITTFSFYNQYTSASSGGAGDFDVYLVGSFNQTSDGTWILDDPNYKMTSDKKGTHTIQVKWPQGSNYEYKYHVSGWTNADTGQDDGWFTDASDGQSNGVANISSCGMNFGQGGGSFVNNSPIKLATQPSVNGKNITFTVSIENDGTITSVTGGSGHPQFNGNTVTDTVPENNKYVYIVKSGDDELYVPVWVEDNAFDWHDALLYFAFTDRFFNADPSNDRKSHTWDHCSASDWYGGDFKGLQQKVESGYFDALGVNTLWISSVTKNTDATSQGTNGDDHNYAAYHSYWPISAFMTDYNQSDFNGLPAIEDHFGTMEELRSLVDACHKRGIRVLVDFAANHVFKDSPMFSKHPNWFNDANNPQLCDNNNNWDNYSEKCWFSQDLPDINYENTEARKTMIDHAIWLIKQTNIDGFRVDAVKHMNIQFIRDLRVATDSLFANTGITFYMVGETFTQDVGLINYYIGNNLLHAQFDFPRYNSIKDNIIGLGNYSNLANLYIEYNSDLMGTFMGNHDVARAISVAAGHNQNKWGYNEVVSPDNWGDNWWIPYLKVKTAFTILLTNPGVPLIYYGDEVGMPGANDPDNRRMMQFDNFNEQQSEMLSYVQKLGQIRKNHKAITRGWRENLSSGAGYWCYKVSDGQETIIVGVSRADGDDNGGCDLHGSYKLENLLDGNNTITENVTGLDLGQNHLQIYLVK